MQTTVPYLSFEGNCREAMELYARVLDAELTLMKYADAPKQEGATDSSCAETAEKAGDLVMHSRLTRKGEPILMASDCPPGMPMQMGDNVMIHVRCDTTEEIDRRFAALSADAKNVLMPLGETFYAARFGMVTDRYGVHWQLIQGERTVPEVKSADEPSLAEKR